MHRRWHAPITAPTISKALTLTGRQGWRSSFPGKKLRTLPGHAYTQEQRQLKCLARGRRKTWEKQQTGTETLTWQNSTAQPGRPGRPQVGRVVGEMR